MPQLLDIEYRCVCCGKEPPKDYDSMICKFCGGDIKGYMCGLIGTRDNFGIKNEFKHKGQTIDTWKKWERAGFSDPLNDTKKYKQCPPEMNSLIKRKIEKITKYDNKKRFSVRTGGSNVKAN